MNNKLCNNISHFFVVVSVVLTMFGCNASTLKSKYEDANSGYTIATYNVRYENGLDNKESRSWLERRGHITRLIAKYDFDIFGVQEPFKNQINDMAVDLTGYRSIGVSDDNLDNSKSSHHHDIFYKTQKFKLESNGKFWLAPGGPTSAPKNLMTTAWGGKAKVCIWAKFRDKTTNAVFYVFNSHFYYANEITRYNSATLILSKIKAISGDLPVIFMGDLNLNQYSKAYGVLNNSTLLKDSYHWAKSLLPTNPAKHQTFNHWLLQPDQVVEVGERIDYIFLTQHWRNKVMSNTVIWDSYLKDGKMKMPSDHNPVMIKLENLW